MNDRIRSFTLVLMIDLGEDPHVKIGVNQSIVDGINYDDLLKLLIPISKTAPFADGIVLTPTLKSTYTMELEKDSANLRTPYSSTWVV